MMVEIFREINIQMLNSRTLHAGLELEWGETSIDTKTTTSTATTPAITKTTPSGLTTTKMETEEMSVSSSVSPAQPPYPNVTSTPKLISSESEPTTTVKTQTVAPQPGSVADDSAISSSVSSSSSIYEQESWVVKLPAVLFICLNRYKFVQATQSSSKILEPFEFYPHIYLDR